MFNNAHNGSAHRVKEKSGRQIEWIKKSKWKDVIWLTINDQRHCSHCFNVKFIFNTRIIDRVSVRHSATNKKNERVKARHNRLFIKHLWKLWITCIAVWNRDVWGWDWERETVFVYDVVYFACESHVSVIKSRWIVQSPPESNYCVCVCVYLCVLCHFRFGSWRFAHFISFHFSILFFFISSFCFNFVFFFHFIHLSRFIEMNAPTLVVWICFFYLRARGSFAVHLRHFKIHQIASCLSTLLTLPLSLHPPTL